jgi:hypothetical protein
LRDSFGAVVLSGGDALSVADFSPSGDKLDALEFILEPLGVLEALVSSLLSLEPFTLGLSSSRVAALGLGA